MRKTVALLLLTSFPWLPSFGQDNLPTKAAVPFATDVAAPSTASVSPTATEINRPIRDKWALVVGVSKFQNKTVPPLRYAAKDARDFRNFLVNEANFAPDHVRLLLDEDATQRRVVSELGSKFLVRVAKSDDVVVLFFSTHGSPSQMDVKGKNFLLSTDSDPDDLFATGIKMDDLMVYAKERINCDRIFVVLDACHASGIAPGEKGVGRVPVIDPEELSQGSGKLIICSSSPEESSWESKRYQNGVFTRKLLEGLRANGKRTTLGEAFQFVEKSVAAEVQEDYAAKQTPIMRSKWNGNDLVLAVPSAAPQAVPTSVTSGLLPDSTLPKVQPKPVLKPVVGSTGDLLMKRGEAELAKNNVGNAIDLLKKSLSLPGTDRARANYNLGRAYAASRLTKEAAAAYRASIAADKFSPSAVLATQALSGGVLSTSTYSAPSTYRSYTNRATWGEGANADNRGYAGGTGVTATLSGGRVPASVISKLPQISPGRDPSPTADSLFNNLDAVDNSDCTTRIMSAEKQLAYAEVTLRNVMNLLQPYLKGAGPHCKELALPYEEYKNHCESILNGERRLGSALESHIKAKQAGTYSGGYGGGYGYGNNTNAGNCNATQGGGNQYGASAGGCKRK